MEKSKLGISINIFAALLYVIGVTNNIFVIALAAGYVLLFESNERLKKTAVKALIITIFLSVVMMLITYLVSLSSQVFNAFSSYNMYSGENAINSSYYRSYFNQFIQSAISSISSIIRIAEILILVLFGFRAYREKDIKIKWIDNIIDKHL